jgi:hypothetical protein
MPPKRFSKPSTFNRAELAENNFQTPNPDKPEFKIED